MRSQKAFFESRWNAELTSPLLLRRTVGLSWRLAILTSWRTAYLDISDTARSCVQKTYHMIVAVAAGRNLKRLRQRLGWRQRAADEHL